MFDVNNGVLLRGQTQVKGHILSLSLHWRSFPKALKKGPTSRRESSMSNQDLEEYRPSFLSDTICFSSHIQKLHFYWGFVFFPCALIKNDFLFFHLCVAVDVNFLSCSAFIICLHLMNESWRTWITAHWNINLLIIFGFPDLYAEFVSGCIQVIFLVHHVTSGDEQTCL